MGPRSYIQPSCPYPRSSLGNTVGPPALCLNRAEPQALSVPAFPSCHSWLSSLPLPPQRPLSPPAGGPRPPVCSHSFLPQSRLFFGYSCPAVLIDLQFHVSFWEGISGKILSHPFLALVPPLSPNLDSTFSLTPVLSSPLF